jgi:hypothetical protein
MLRNLLLCLTLAAGIAGAATYKVTLRHAATVKGAQLTPGEYRIEVDGGRITFVNGKQSAQAPVKVETAEKKFSDTLIVYNGAAITEISIGGTKTKLTLE